MTMPKTIWVSETETIGKCNPKYYWPNGWPSVFKQKRDGSTKYHSEAALIEMLEGMKLHSFSLDLNPTIGKHHNTAIDAVIEKVRGM